MEYLKSSILHYSYFHKSEYSGVEWFTQIFTPLIGAFSLSLEDLANARGRSVVMLQKYANILSDHSRSHKKKCEVAVSFLPKLVTLALFYAYFLFHVDGTPHPHSHTSVKKDSKFSHHSSNRLEVPSSSNSLADHPIKIEKSKIKQIETAFEPKEVKNLEETMRKVKTS